MRLAIEEENGVHVPLSPLIDCVFLLLIPQEWDAYSVDEWRTRRAANA